MKKLNEVLCKCGKEMNYVYTTEDSFMSAYRCECGEVDVISHYKEVKVQCKCGNEMEHEYTTEDGFMSAYICSCREVNVIVNE